MTNQKVFYEDSSDLFSSVSKLSCLTHCVLGSSRLWRQPGRKLIEMYKLWFFAPIDTLRH